MRIWSHLLKKSLMENFIFCAVSYRDSLVQRISNFVEITLWHDCSPVNWRHIFRTPFPKNTSGWLLLNVF